MVVFGLKKTRSGLYGLGSDTECAAERRAPVADSYTHDDDPKWRNLASPIGILQVQQVPAAA